MSISLSKRHDYDMSVYQTAYYYTVQNDSILGSNVRHKSVFSLENVTFKSVV